MADDQGWGDMAYNGHPVLKTPNFDAMASEALRFNRFYAAAPVCSPTRGSVLTGRHPNRFGCFTAGYSLRPQEETIAETLKAAGYVTGHFGKWHLGSIFKNSPVNPGGYGFNEWVSAPNFFDNDPILSKNGSAIQFKGESSMVTVDAAIDFIRRHSQSDQPFLAVVWFGSPHRPLKAIEQDAALYSDQPEQLQHYYGEITGMDRALGKLRNELRTLNIHENTILWYCSDNGGLKGTNRIRGHKSEIYDGGLRVPAILEWPKRIKTPRTTDIPCNTSDIYPTIMELIGAKPDKKLPLDGTSLAPLIDKKMKARPKPMGFWHYPAEVIRISGNEDMSVLLDAQKSGKQIEDKWLCLDANKNRKFPDDEFPGHSAWLDWPWKLHRIETKGIVTLELYNIAKDIGENNDLSAQQPQRVREMKSELEQWMKSVVHSLNGEDYQ
ncbi:MAG: hypothetical protein A2Y10_05700 [Planctomycetes bacterium GWF2_41_51]|nr:MAG: hypothetical protein A2Y10_05700 [Planctomycetes bacterium GWF2_41_51]